MKKTIEILAFFMSLSAIISGNEAGTNTIAPGDDDVAQMLAYFASSNSPLRNLENNVPSPLPVYVNRYDGKFPESINNIRIIPCNNTTNFTDSRLEITVESITSTQMIAWACWAEPFGTKAQGASGDRGAFKCIFVKKNNIWNFEQIAAERIFGHGHDAKRSKPDDSHGDKEKGMISTSGNDPTHITKDIILFFGDVLQFWQNFSSGSFKF